MEINLLEKERYFFKKEYFKVRPVIFLVVASLFLLFRHQILSHQSSKLKERIYHLQHTLKILNDHEGGGLKKKDQATAQMLKELKKSRDRLVNLFDGIQQHAKRSLTLTRLTIDHQGIKVKGRAAVIADLTRFAAAFMADYSEGSVIEKIDRHDDHYDFSIVW